MRAGRAAAGGSASRPRPPRRAGRRAGEQVRHLPVALVPGRHRGVADEGGGVGGDGRAEQARAEGGRGPGGGQDPGHLGHRGGPGHRAVGGEQPGADAHRRARLEHPQHVDEPLRPAQVVHQGHGGQADRAERADLGHPGQLAVAGQLGAGRQHRRRARQAAEEQVPGHVRGPPRRFLDHRAAVVGGELGVRHHAAARPGGAGGRRGRHGRGRGPAGRSRPGSSGPHFRRPRPRAMPAAASPAAARPTCFQMLGRSRVVTTGSGGRPYTSGSSSSRKNAPPPPMPSSGSSR